MHDRAAHDLVTLAETAPHPILFVIQYYHIPHATNHIKPSLQYNAGPSIVLRCAIASHDAQIDLSSIPVLLALCRTN